MVAGQTLPMVNKPISRSDNEVVDPEQDLRITHEVKAQYESMIPKRPIKPNRSEPDPDALEVHQQPINSQPIPELQKLMSLKSYKNQQGVLETGGEGVVQEEFVETEYYKQLVAIDKHHHTTGTGFIKVKKEEVGNGENYEMSILSENERKIKIEFSFGYKSNPATNDWTPSVEQVEYVSTKPSRSG